MKKTILIGGKAGQGPNVLSEVIALGLLEEGYHVFYSRDYQSLIRGGHNFNILTFSDKPISSNESKIDILICLDEKTKEIHKKILRSSSLTLDFKQGEDNMFYAGRLFRALGLSLENLERQLKKIDRYEENIEEAKKGFNFENKKVKLDKPKKEKINIGFLNGSQAISLGAIKSGLDFYYAYPMTPATPIMFELGQETLKKDNKHKVIELESEIAVINAALGSSMIGKFAMVGTSGGGFDLMTEALSMSGMAEIPIVIYLAQRPGPSTGVATYTGQGDLKLALNAGHGEFSRIVIAPGDPEEAEEAVNLCFYLSEKFRVPCILLGDKHLGESKYTITEKPKLMKIEKAKLWPNKFNSYEHDAEGIATEEAGLIKKNFEGRNKKSKDIEKEAEKLECFKVYGDEKSKKVIIGWGSTKGAIINALESLELNSNLDLKFIQILFLEPFSSRLEEEIKKHKPEDIILIENNATSPLSDLIAEKTLIKIHEKNKILKYDARPFFSDELAKEIERRVK